MDLEATTVELAPVSGLDPRVEVWRAGDEVDTFAVFAERFVALVDTASTPDLARRQLDRLRPRLAGRPLLVINTHADYDHAYGNAVFAPGGDFPALIVGHRLCAARLDSERERARLAERQTEAARYADVRLVPPQILVDDALDLAGGDLTLRLLHAPGHTEDHLALWIPELRVLLAADAAEFPFPHVGDAAGLREARATLARLRDLRPDVVLACHGHTTAPDLLDANLRYFDEVERRVRGRAEGADPEAAFPYADALAFVGADPDRVAPFYERFHRDALRAAAEG